MRLYLIRHGQTAWNAEQRAQGHADISLDELGLEQARQLGERFAGKRIDRILTSDLERARYTAAPIGLSTGAPIEETTILRERKFGDWEGEYFRDIASWWPALEAIQGVNHLKLRPPNGESFADVWNRLEPLVQDLMHDQSTTVLVSHGGTCGLLMARLILGNLETARAFRFANTSVTKLERRHDGLFTIQYYNDTRHLSTGAMSGSVDGSTR
ncbi:MAG TPA: histidine phosphatase family protein [Fimbriimonadaceae bacterium]|nr:histidine phosphatase family protein [Fimbriimonadaceae bacterium]